MKNLLLSLLFCLIPFLAFTQDELTTQLKTDYNNKKYDLIIRKHTDKINDYPAKAIYYVGMAHYAKANDAKVIELMNLSLEKDSTDADTHYIKGMTLNYMGKFNEAITSFNKAIVLDATMPNYHCGLGDSYFNKEDYKEALSSYKTSTEQDDAIDRAFVMIPQVYAKLNQPKETLDAFYIAKQMISKDTDSYTTVLYNIGLYEFLNKSYDKSEIVLKELIELAPNDFESYCKLIQVYYGKQEYEKAEPYRAQLYEAYNDGVLEGYLKDSFCFDQFDWNDNLVLVYENFADKEGELYYKHIFYITDKTGETLFTIQTENSPISVELGGPQFLLGMDKKGTHRTFQFGFEKDLKYADLKKAVLLVLNEE